MNSMDNYDSKTRNDDKTSDELKIDNKTVVHFIVLYK